MSEDDKGKGGEGQKKETDSDPKMVPEADLTAAKAEAAKEKAASEEAQQAVAQLQQQMFSEEYRDFLREKKGEGDKKDAAPELPDFEAMSEKDRALWTLTQTARMVDKAVGEAVEPIKRTIASHRVDTMIDEARRAHKDFDEHEKEMEDLAARYLAAGRAIPDPEDLYDIVTGRKAKEDLTEAQKQLGEQKEGAASLRPVSTASALGKFYTADAKGVKEAVAAAIKRVKAGETE